MTASRSPAGVARTQASRWAATTRAGCQPAASNGRKAAAQPGSQPRSARGVVVDGHHPTRLSLPVRFAYRSARPKAHSPAGMSTMPITISGTMS